MTERRFHEGDQFEIPPFQYRVVRGSKAPDDLRLDWRWQTEWRPVELDHVFLIVDAIADNENVIRPSPQSGGGKVYAAVVTALRYGWRKARHDLHLERARYHDPAAYRDRAAG
jgi:hypothetical protein